MQPAARRQSNHYVLHTVLSPTTLLIINAMYALPSFLKIKAPLKTEVHILAGMQHELPVSISEQYDFGFLQCPVLLSRLLTALKFSLILPP